MAGSVGGWITELFGVHDLRVLEAAFALGRAIQLTNILRDVGEDLRLGRLYLPRDRMDRHGVDRALLEVLEEVEGIPYPGYVALLEELMAEADRGYEEAMKALPALPPFLRRAVAVAARGYQGIHEEIRRNGYDNLTLRARVFLLRKLQEGLRPGDAFHTVMLEREMRRRPWLRLLGAVGLEPGRPASLRRLLKALEARRRETHALSVLFFPQGRIWPAHRRPLGFQGGVRLVGRALTPVSVIPVAVHLDPGVYPAPTAFLSVGKRMDPFMDRIRPIYDAVIGERLGARPFDRLGTLLRFLPR